MQSEKENWRKLMLVSREKVSILIQMQTIPRTIWEELDYPEMTGILKDPSIKIEQLRILRVSRDVMLINPFFNVKQN
jgi:hypothetical protein